MPAIKIGVSEQKAYGTLPEGNYEVYVHSFDEVSTTDDIDSSRIRFTVRSDVGGEFAKYNAFTNIRSSWGWMLNGLSKALGISPDTEYPSLGDFLSDIRGRSLVIRIKHKPNPTDTSKVYVNVTDFFPTTKGDFVSEDTVSSSDLPF
jgi:hypothetical protein